MATAFFYVLLVFFAVYGIVSMIVGIMGMQTREERCEIIDKHFVIMVKNAEDTIPLVEYDSRLGWEQTMLYLTDRRHLEWKIRQVRYVLESDLPKYKHGLLQWHS